MSLLDQFGRPLVKKVTEQIENQLGNNNENSQPAQTQESPQQAQQQPPQSTPPPNNQQQANTQNQNFGRENLAGKAMSNAGKTVNEAAAQGQQTIADTLRTSKYAAFATAALAAATTQLGGVQVMIVFGFVSHIFDLFVAENNTFFVNSLTIGADIAILIVAFILNFFNTEHDMKDWILRLVAVCFAGFLEIRGFGLVVISWFGEGYLDPAVLNPINKMWVPVWFLAGCGILIWRGELFTDKHRAARGLFFLWIAIWTVLLMGHVTGFVEERGWTDPLNNPIADEQNAEAQEKFGALENIGAWMKCVVTDTANIGGCVAERTKTPEQKEAELQNWFDQTIGSQFTADLNPYTHVSIGENQIIIETNLENVDNNHDEEKTIIAQVSCGTINDKDMGVPNPSTIYLEPGLGAWEKITCKLESLPKRDTRGVVSVVFENLTATSVLPSLYWTNNEKSDAIDNFRKNTNSLEYAQIVKRHENAKKFRQARIINEIFESVPQTSSYLPENFPNNYENSLVLSSSSREFLVPIISLGGQAVQGIATRDNDELSGRFLVSRLSLSVLNNAAKSSTNYPQGNIKKINTKNSFLYLPKFLEPVFDNDNCLLLKESGEKDTQSLRGHVGYEFRPRVGDEGNPHLNGLGSLEANDQKSLGTCLLKVTNSEVGERIIFDTITARISYDYEKSVYSTLDLASNPDYEPDEAATARGVCMDNGIYEKPSIKWLSNTDTSQIEDKIKKMAYAKKTYSGRDPPKNNDEFIIDFGGEEKKFSFDQLALAVATHESTTTLKAAGDGGYSIPPFNIFICQHPECMRESANSDYACTGPACSTTTVADNLECAIEAGLRFLWSNLQREKNNNKDFTDKCGTQYDTPAERALRRYNGMTPDCNQEAQKCYVHKVAGIETTC